MGKPREAVNIMTDEQAAQAAQAAAATEENNARGMEQSQSQGMSQADAPTPESLGTPVPTPEPAPPASASDSPAGIPTPALRRAGVSPTGKEPAPPAQPDYSIPSPYYIPSGPLREQGQQGQQGQPFDQSFRYTKENKNVHNLHPAGSVPPPAPVDARYEAYGINRDNPVHPLHGVEEGEGEGDGDGNGDNANADKDQTAKSADKGKK